MAKLHPYKLAHPSDRGSSRGGVISCAPKIAAGVSIIRLVGLKPRQLALVTLEPIALDGCGQVPL